MINLTEKAQEIINARYIVEGKDRTWDDISRRVGKGIGADKYGEAFSQIISEMYFIPGGRILRNVGRARGSLFNCYNLPIGDSREEIGELFKNALILWGEGGGVGINFSTLRPKGAPIKGVGGNSSGLVSFMRAVDGIAATIESGGQRRAASLGLCEVWHPEINAFINAKTKDGDISYFNISVGITESFLDAVRADEKWRLHFNQQEWEMVSANKLWADIMHNMVRNGEPGLINMTNLQQNNSYYFAPVRGTNPCGETCLEDYGVCNLGSLVLPQFVSQSGNFRWKNLEEVTKLAVRFLDTTIDNNKYTLDRIKQTAQRGRRIGLGVMGLADCLFAMGLRYGSTDALDFVGQLFKRIRNYAYEASIELACEKGSFPAFDSTLYSKAKFVKSLPFRMRQDIRKYGTRNVTLLAVAPTGTISLIPECTSSIEPLMYKAYERKDRVSNRTYIHKIARDFAGKRAPDWFVDSKDISPQEHLDTQIAVQKFVDGAVSKTINVPNTFKSSELSEMLLESIQDLKGVTVYREGSRTGQIITPLSQTKIKEALKKNEKIASPEEHSVSCSTGTCEM